ncbi:MAG TPA: Ig-like domain-containing protein, partial [Chitinophagales bacterium]|nr:Ig-like domain-containing protein [Chitinophagales bacterium]
GTATIADSDYGTATGTLTFIAGETSKTISVLINGDTKVEADETFTVELSNLVTNGRNITLADGSGQGTITNDDNAPVLEDITKSGTEDQTITFTESDFTNAFNDADGDDLVTVEVVSLPANGDLYLNSVLVTPGQLIPLADLDLLTFVPDGNWFGTTTFDYNATDGTNWAVEDAQVIITINSSNDAPVAVNDEVTTPEDTPVAGTVLTNDSDPEGDQLTVTQFVIGSTTYLAGVTATIPGVGTLVINSNGSFQFVPVLNYNGSVPAATYTITDGNGGFDTADLLITVTAVNDPPVLVDDAYTLCSSTTSSGNILTNGDADPDGTALTVNTVPVTDALHGTFTIESDGDYTYDPDNGYNGTDFVVVEICDSGVPGIECANSTITFTVNQAVTAAAGADQSLCDVTTATLAGNDPSPGTGLWTLISGPNVPAITTPSAYNSTVTGMIPGTYVLRWTISNGVCASSSDDVSLINYDSPTTASAGSDQEVCGLEATLAGNTATSGTGTWTQTDGPIGGTATFSSANSPTSTATVDEYGTYEFTWTITNGTCPSSSDVVNITYTAAPSTATAGADQDICGSLVSAVLGGNTPVTGTGAWSIVSGGTGTFDDDTDPDAVFTADAYGTYVLRWTISNGVCTPSTADVTVNYYETPTTATVGSTQNHCATLTSTGLGGNTPLVGTGAWSITSGGTGTFTAPTSGNSNFVANAYGTYVLTWTISNGTCTPSAASITVNFYETPTPATVGADQSLCGTLTSGALGGNTPTAGTGAWSIVSGGTGSFSNSASGSSTFTADTYGTYELRWTISNGTCTPSTADITVIFYETAPAAAAGADQSLCDVTTATLAGNDPSPGTGLWTLISGPNVPAITTPSAYNSTVTGMIPGTYVLRWTISNGVCASSSDDVSLINYDSPTTASAGSDQEVCGLEATLAGNTATSGTGTWTQTDGPIGGTATFSSANSPTSTATVDEYGTYEFTWTITNGTCPSSSDVVNITYTAAPSTATAGADQDICGSLVSAVLGGNTPVTGTGAWSIVSGGTGTFDDDTDPDAVFTADAYGTYVLRWTISNGVCTPSTADVTVNYYQNISADAGDDQTLCAATSTVLIGNTPSSGSSGWSFISGPNTPVILPTSGSMALVSGMIASTTPYVFRYTITNGTCTSTDDVTVTNYNSPTPAFAGNDQTICSTTPATATMDANTPVYGTGEWTQESGAAATITTPSSPSTTITGLNTGTYVFRWTISNGVCASSSDLVTITIASPATVDAGTDQTICEAGTATMAATASGYVSLLWTTSGTGTFNSAITEDPVYTPSLSDIANGSVVLTLTATATTGCPQVSDQMTLTINPQAIVS